MFPSVLHRVFNKYQRVFLRPAELIRFSLNREFEPGFSSTDFSLCGFDFSATGKAHRLNSVLLERRTLILFGYQRHTNFYDGSLLKVKRLGRNKNAIAIARPDFARRGG